MSDCHDGTDEKNCPLKPGRWLRGRCCCMFDRCQSVADCIFVVVLRFCANVILALWKTFFLNQFDMYIHHWVVTFVFLIYDCYSMMCQLYICTLLSLSFLVTRPPARGKDLLIPLLKCLVFSVSPSKFLFFQYNISKIIIIHFNIIFSDSPNHIAVANSKQNSQISLGVNLWVNTHSYFYEFKI